MAQNIFDKSTVATTIKAKKAEEARLKMQYKRASKMNKGFFDTAKEELYPADKEGQYSVEGILPEGAGEPLGWMPKSLRSKVQICDPSTTSGTVQYSTVQYSSEISTSYRSTAERTAILPLQLNLICM